METEKLSGDPKIDFPELFENKIDNEDNTIDEYTKLDAFYKQRQLENEFQKKAIIDEVLDNVEIKPDFSIYDKRLKRPLLKRILDAIFGDDRI